jgi:hypothetical protein
VVTTRQCIEGALNCRQDEVATCWQYRWVIQLGLTLSYLVTLASLGALVGLVLTPGTRDGESGYLNFDLTIEPAGDARYRVESGGDRGAEGTAYFDLPDDFVSDDFWHRCLRGPLRGEPVDAATGITRPQPPGEELFRKVFQGEVSTSFQSYRDKARGRSGLRIRLRLNGVPELASLPWEYMHDGSGFLALSERTSLVRYLKLNKSTDTLEVKPPLRILVMIAQHRDWAELAADEEFRRLVKALKPLGNRIAIERLQGATREALERRLTAHGEKPIHVFHFIGHGGFSQIADQGVLYFEDQNGKNRPIEGEDLAYLLIQHPSLRLAVLNACQGAWSSPKDVFAGTAQNLVRQGVPAVIAMQRTIADQTSLRFAEVFYRALADCKALDACVGSARWSLHEQHNEEWGVPVLYLRATDEHLFTLADQEA